MTYGKATIRGVWHIVKWVGIWQTGRWTTACGREHHRLAAFFGYLEDEVGREPNGAVCKRCLKRRKK